MRGRTVSILIAALWLVGGADPRARGEELRLGDVLAAALQNNPGIRAAREKARAARQMPQQAAAWDDPTFSYEAWNAPESFDLSRAGNNIFKLSQKVPFPGKRALAGRIAERDADVAERDLDGARLDLCAEVKRAFYGLWQTHERLRVFARDEDLVRQLAAVAEQKYALGQASQPDVLRAQVELTRLINRVTTESLAIDAARAELDALLSRPAPGPLGTPEDPPPPALGESADALIALALERRPELAAASAAVERSRQSARLAGLDYLPDFEFTLERFFNFGARDGVGAMASVSLPFVYKYKYDAALAEARAKLAAAEADLRRARDRVQKEVAQAFLRARAALLEHELLATTHVPQAEQALQASRIGYETGKVDFLSLIDSVRAIESIHLEHIRASTEFEQAYADLERAVGQELPRPGRK